jgi:polyhydroxyalkanoate synthase
MPRGEIERGLSCTRLNGRAVEDYRPFQTNLTALHWMTQSQSGPAEGALEALCQAQFLLTDVLRRAQADALGVFGLNPSECSYNVIASGRHWRLRDYGGSDSSLCLLVVAAPIKRAYIWDIAPSASAVRYCLEQGLQVYLLEWRPACSATGNNGIDEHVEAVFECIRRVSKVTGGVRPFLVGHSLGGTLAAIFGALAPQDICGLVLLSAPLCFEPRTSGFRDALVSLIPSTISDAGSFPGSLLSYVTVMASPNAFLWSRLRDAASSAVDPSAMDIYARVERWALDEVAVSGKLFQQMVTWLYRENRLCRGTLNVRDTRVGPSTLSAPTIAVVNTADEVAPLVSIKPFIDAASTKDTRIIEYPHETGVCLQHLGILVGREARNRIWPQVISWLHSHR